MNDARVAPCRRQVGERQRLGVRAQELPAAMLGISIFEGSRLRRRVRVDIDAGQRHLHLGADVRVHRGHDGRLESQALRRDGRIGDSAAEGVLIRRNDIFRDVTDDEVIQRGHVAIVTGLKANKKRVSALTRFWLSQ